MYCFCHLTDWCWLYLFVKASRSPTLVWPHQHCGIWLQTNRLCRANSLCKSQGKAHSGIITRWECVIYHGHLTILAVLLFSQVHNYFWQSNKICALSVVPTDAQRSSTQTPKTPNTSSMSNSLPNLWWTWAIRWPPLTLRRAWESGEILLWCPRPFHFSQIEVGRNWNLLIFIIFSDLVVCM